MRRRSRQWAATGSLWNWNDDLQLEADVRADLEAAFGPMAITMPVSECGAGDHDRHVGQIHAAMFDGHRREDRTKGARRRACEARIPMIDGVDETEAERAARDLRVVRAAARFACAKERMRREAEAWAERCRILSSMKADAIARREAERTSAIRRAAKRREPIAPCRVPGCLGLVPVGYMMCAHCWALVPNHLQERVRQALWNNREDDYQTAAADCIMAVAIWYVAFGAAISGSIRPGEAGAPPSIGEPARGVATTAVPAASRR